MIKLPARPDFGRLLLYTRDSGGKAEMTPGRYVLAATGHARTMNLAFNGDEAMMESLIKYRGYESGDIYLDYDFSGNLMVRPGLDALQRRIAADRSVSHLFFPRRDRVSRPDDVTDALKLEGIIRQTGVTLIIGQTVLKPLRRNERIDFGEFVTAAYEYHNSGKERREMAKKSLDAQMALGNLAFATGGRPCYAFRRWLVLLDGTPVCELNPGVRIRQAGHHVAWLPVPQDHPEMQIALRIVKELSHKPAGRIARELTRERVPPPDFGRVRTDNKVAHLTSGVWHSNTVTAIGRNALLAAIATYGKRSMGDQLRYSPAGARDLNDDERLPPEECRLDRQNVKVVRNRSEDVLRRPAHFAPVVDPADHHSLQRILDERGATQRGKPRSRTPGSNPLGARLFDMNCAWVMYRSPYGGGFRYSCGLYSQSHGEHCDHNIVDGPTAARFALNRLRENCCSPAMLAKVKNRLKELASRESTEQASKAEFHSARATLESVRLEHKTAKRNLALAKSDVQFAAVGEIVEELARREVDLEREVLELEKNLRPVKDMDQEVAAALSLFSKLSDLAGDSANLAAIEEACRTVNLRVFFRFEKRKQGKRILNRVAKGIVTFGVQPPPVEIYDGPTGRGRLKATLAAMAAANPGGGGPRPDVTSSGMGGNSLGNVSRGDRI